eukprot:scaffold2671_cov252-Pinguiococcus_pyrenoidosus.AAC.2
MGFCACKHSISMRPNGTNHASMEIPITPRESFCMGRRRHDTQSAALTTEELVYGIPRSGASTDSRMTWGWSPRIVSGVENHGEQARAARSHSPGSAGTRHSRQSHDPSLAPGRTCPESTGSWPSACSGRPGKART